MTEQEGNEATVARIDAACRNEGDMEVIDEIFDADVRHEQFPPGWPTGREGFKTLVKFFRNAFPDLNEIVVDLIADDDQVASRFRLRGTHGGEFHGVPVTGRKVDIHGAEVFRFEGVKVVDYVDHEDTPDLYFQLGALPLPQRALAGVAGNATWSSSGGALRRHVLP